MEVKGEVTKCETGKERRECEIQNAKCKTGEKCKTGKVRRVLEYAGEQI